MILTCPECEAQYSLPDGTIPKEGRSVRCANCSYVWRAAPEPSDEDIASEPTSATTERDEQLAAIKAAMEEEAQFEEKLDSDKDIISEWADEEDEVETIDEAPEEIIEEVVDPEAPAVATRDSVIKRVVMPVAEPAVEAPTVFKEEHASTPTITTALGANGETRIEPTLSAEPVAPEEFIADAIPVKNAGPTVGWVLLFLFLAALLGVFFFAEDRVLALWPAASVLYDMVGSWL